MLQIYRNIILVKYSKPGSGPGIFVYEFLCRRSGQIGGFCLSQYLRPLFSLYAPAGADRMWQKVLGLMYRTAIVLWLFLRSAKTCKFIVDFANDFWMLASSVFAESTSEYVVGRSCLVFWTTACLIFENSNKIPLMIWKIQYFPRLVQRI